MRYKSICFLFLWLGFLFFPTVAYGGFKETSRTYSARHNAAVHTFKHEKSGAKLIYIETDDTEKSFGIGFKTPAADDTGVNHILEHCLLNGSGKSDDNVPFTWLLNHSSATFLNAMTFADFTLYVLASRDEEEYRRLMRVYLDDVFFPKVLSDRAIFEQEGWRTEKDASGAAVYNGTVYNEMKGVYSTDRAYLERAVSQALFPNTQYRFDSGGLPNAILDLTYDKFIEVYTRHYKPSNALLFLYGKQDLAATLPLLEEYLSRFSITPNGVATDSRLDRESAFSRPARSTVTYPAEDGRSLLALGYCVSDRSDAVQSAEMELLSDLLADGDDSPLNQAILTQNIAEKVYTQFNGMQNSCTLNIILEGLDPAQAEAAENAVYDCLRRVVKQGVAPEQLQKLKNRQAYFLASSRNQPHQGINANIEAMGGFVYGFPMGEEQYSTAIERLNQKRVKKLVAQGLLHNNHRCVVLITPKNANKPNTAYVAPIVTPPHFSQEQAGKALLIHTRLDTHGVAALHVYLDGSCVPRPLLGYAQILARTLGNFDTLPSSYSSELGESQGYFAADTPYDCDDSFTPRFHFILKGLENKTQAMSYAASYLLDKNLPPNAAVVKRYLQDTKTMIEQQYENNMPIFDCLARVSVSGRFNYEISGPAYYKFVLELLDDFDRKWPEIAKSMQTTKELLLSGDRPVVSFSGSEAAYLAFRKQAAPLLERLQDDGAKQNTVDYDFFPLSRNAHYDAPLSQTCAVVQGGSLKSADRLYNGAFLVAASLINYDYLWPKIRDEGGAYGINVSVTPAGAVMLRSYRDPNPHATLEVYQGIPNFLDSLSSGGAADYEGVKRHVLAEWDEQFQPYRQWDYGAKVVLGLINPEKQRQTRLEIEQAQPSELIYDCDTWNRILSQGIIATGGKNHTPIALPTEKKQTPAEKPVGVCFFYLSAS